MPGTLNVAASRALLGVVSATTILSALVAAQRFNVTYNGAVYGAKRVAPQRCRRRPGHDGAPARPPPHPVDACVQCSMHPLGRPATFAELYSVDGSSSALAANLTSTFWWGNSTAAKVSSRRPARAHSSGSPTAASGHLACLPR